MTTQERINQQLARQPQNEEEVIGIAHELSLIIGERVPIRHTRPNIWEYLDNKPCLIHWSNPAIVIGKIVTKWHHLQENR